jgi:periplasmic protein TonB
MTRSLGQLRMAAAFAGACLAGSLALAVSGAQAQDAGYTPPHVDLSYRNLQPPYPSAAVVNGEHGSVIMNVQVSSNGKPRTAAIYKSSGFDDLDTAALQAVLNWRFVPAMRSGETETNWALVKVDFQLPTPASTQSP